MLGAVLIAAIAGRGRGGLGPRQLADTKAKPDPTVVAAQRSAAAKASAADTQERERVAWLDSANTSVKRLDARRAAYRQSLARATTPSDQAAAARRLASSFAAGQALVKDAPASVTGAAALRRCHAPRRGRLHASRPPPLTTATAPHTAAPPARCATRRPMWPPR